MRFLKPINTLIDIKNNVAQLNEGIDVLEEKILCLPCNDAIDINFKPALNKRELKELKFTCRYSPILGNNESRWLLKQTYNDPNPKPIPNNIILQLGRNNVDITFDLTYSIKRKTAGFKLHSIWSRGFQNEKTFYNGKYVVPDGDNNVIQILRNGFGYSVDAMSRASVKHKSYDFEWFSRALKKILEAIEADSIGMAQQAVNIAQTGAALGVLK